MQMRTFGEWSSLGYKIKKGSRATWIDDVAKFSEKQVVKYRPRMGYNNFTDLSSISEDLEAAVGGPDVGYGVDWRM